MRAPLLPLASLVLLAGPFLMAGRAACEEADGMAWLTDLDAARTAARRDGKPLLIVFR